MAQQTRRQASYDQIVMSIHILWERGWQVTPESVHEMLTVGGSGMHVESSREAIEQVMATTCLPGAEKQWLRYFNYQTEWTQTHPRPLPIDSNTWKHQQQEEETPMAPVLTTEQLALAQAIYDAARGKGSDQWQGYNLRPALGYIEQDVRESFIPNLIDPADRSLFSRDEIRWIDAVDCAKDYLERMESGEEDLIREIRVG